MQSENYYQAWENWLSPWVAFPETLIEDLTQEDMVAYNKHIDDDSFATYVILAAISSGLQRQQRV